MRVEAIKLGFYDGQRRRPGVEFEVPEGTTGKWFVPVVAVNADGAAPKRQRKTKVADATEATPDEQDAPVGQDTDDLV